MPRNQEIPLGKQIQLEVLEASKRRRENGDMGEVKKFWGIREEPGGVSIDIILSWITMVYRRNRLQGSKACRLRAVREITTKKNGEEREGPGLKRTTNK